MSRKKYTSTPTVSVAHSLTTRPTTNSARLRENEGAGTACSHLGMCSAAMQPTPALVEEHQPARVSYARKARCSPRRAMARAEGRSQNHRITAVVEDEREEEVGESESPVGAGDENVGEGHGDDTPGHPHA